MKPVSSIQIAVLILDVLMASMPLAFQRFPVEGRLALVLSAGSLALVSEDPALGVATALSIAFATVVWWSQHAHADPAREAFTVGAPYEQSPDRPTLPGLDKQEVHAEADTVARISERLALTTPELLVAAQTNDIS